MLKLVSGWCDWTLESTGSVGCIAMTGLGFQLNGTNVDGNSCPMGVRGTTTPFERSHCVLSVPAWRPMLTPSSVTGMRVRGEPVVRARVVRLSVGWRTRAERPKGMGGRWGLNPDKASFGVKGDDALHIELLRVSPTLWWSRSVSSGGRWYGRDATTERARACTV